MRLKTTGHLALALWLTLPLIACQGTGSVIKDHAAGKGENRTYGVSLDQAWEISRHVLRWEGSRGLEEHPEENYMIASFGINLVSWGSLAGVSIEPCGDKASVVTVVCKRKMAAGIATVLTEDTFFRWFDRGVGIVSDGKPLPDERPE